MSHDRKVVVVGAGLAGLAAACSFIRDGFDVTVLEARRQAGGRVTGETVAGYSIDLGANFLLETDSTALHLARGLGVPLHRTPVPIHSGIWRHGRFHGLYGGTGLASHLKNLRTMLSFRLLSPRGLVQASSYTALLKTRKHDLRLDVPSRMLDLDTPESAAGYFQAHIGSESLDWLFGPGLSGYTFAHPEQIGSASAMAILWNHAISPSWPCLPEGGLRTFVTALTRVCSPHLLTSTPARRIRLENGRVTGVLTDHGPLDADVVICSTTADIARSLVPDMPDHVHHALGMVAYSKCCRIFFGLDTSPLPHTWYAVGFPRQTGGLITGMSTPSLLAPGTAPQGKALVDAIAIDKAAEDLFAMPDDAVARHTLDECRNYFPTMSTTPFFSRVCRWDQAMCLLPGGAMTALNRLHRDDFRIIDGLFFAGDFLGVPSMEAALASGLEAARAASRFLHR